MPPAFFARAFTQIGEESYAIAKTSVGPGSASCWHFNCICPRHAPADQCRRCEVGSSTTEHCCGRATRCHFWRPFQRGPIRYSAENAGGLQSPCPLSSTVRECHCTDGEFHVGMGDKLDTDKGMLLRPGGYVEAPAKMHHYAR